MRSRIPGGARSSSLAPSFGSWGVWLATLSAWPHSCHATHVSRRSRVGGSALRTAGCISLMSTRRSSATQIPRASLSASVCAQVCARRSGAWSRSLVTSPSGRSTISHCDAPICSSRRRWEGGSVSQASWISCCVVASPMPSFDSTPRAGFLNRPRDGGPSRVRWRSQAFLHERRTSRAP